jgi:hypothetical protein
MHVAASQCVLIIGVNLIRPKDSPDPQTFVVACAALQTHAFAIRTSTHDVAKLCATFVLQIFLHEITDTAGLFLFLERLIFISNIYESCPQLTHLSSRRRTNRPAPASRLFRGRISQMLSGAGCVQLLCHSGDTDSCARIAAFEKAGARREVGVRRRSEAGTTGRPAPL